MTLSFQKQDAGGLTLVRCSGRIVEGSETAALQREVEAQFDETPHVVLDLSGIEFIDSSGLGLLVRLMNRARVAGGDLRICAVSPRLKEILRVTRLDKVLPPYTSSGEAIAATYDHARDAQKLDRLAADVLCVAESRDMLVYVCEILRQAGFAVMSSDNLPDALMLLRAVRPRTVVMSAGLRAARGTGAANAFNTLADTRAVVELPADFSHDDAGDAGILLLERVRSAMG
jgi:anti-sigma B factor antagonist